MVHGPGPKGSMFCIRPKKCVTKENLHVKCESMKRNEVPNMLKETATAP